MDRRLILFIVLNFVKRRGDFFFLFDKIEKFFVRDLKPKKKKSNPNTGEILFFFRN